MRKFVALITSLKLTIVCLAAAMALIFAGTLAQVHLRNSRSAATLFPKLVRLVATGSSQGFRIPIFPGGHLIGAVLLINLIAAHAKRFRWAWRKLGIHLTHAGLIIMLAGGLFTDLFAVESHMQLAGGETKNYSEDSQTAELAVIDTTAPEFDQVTAIPGARLLRHKRIIDHPESAVPDRRPELLSEFATANVGARLEAARVQPRTRDSARKLPCKKFLAQPASMSAISSARDRNRADWIRHRTWSTIRSGPGWFRMHSARRRHFPVRGPYLANHAASSRYYKPYSVTLQKFTHERYPGTEIPKNFASKITLNDPERAVNRDVLIYMNHPLRYRGETFYQAGFQKDDQASILQVVHNPSFIAPYVACVVVGRRIARSIRLPSRRICAAKRNCARMKRFFPAILFVLALLWVASSWRPPRAAPDDFDLAKFGKIPVLVGGRVKPLDTVARNSLLIIHGKQTVRLDEWQTTRRTCAG